MPPKVKTLKERQQLHKLILDAARDLFVQHDVEAVSMPEIAKRVGYLPTTIYLYFKDKNDLLQTLCDHDSLILTNELRNTNADAVQQLKELCSAYFRFALAYPNPNHYRFMFMTSKPNNSKEKSKLRQGNIEQNAYALLRSMVQQTF